jgi:hypothetical protein
MASIMPWASETSLHGIHLCHHRTTTALTFMTGYKDWPGGKPHFALPAWIPSRLN